MARLDTGWCVHPKILALSVAGMAVHAWSISYCDLARSDGFIPEGAWPSKKGFEIGIKELLKAGLWTRVEGGGYLLHDFKVYNRTRAQIELAQAEDRARKAEDSGRNPNGIPRARAQTRSGDPVPVPINSPATALSTEQITAGRRSRRVATTRARAPTRGCRRQTCRGRGRSLRQLAPRAGRRRGRLNDVTRD